MREIRWQEWLETDGRGGFASGTISGARSRRYHGLLTVATTPPTGRFLLVNGFEAWVETTNGTYQLTTQRYAPDVVYPQGYERIERFSTEPWPKWLFRLEDGSEIEHEIFMAHGSALTAVSWKLTKKKKGTSLLVRPLFSGRNAHSLHAENKDFRFEPIVGDHRATWRPYDSVPGIIAVANGHWTQQPVWYRQFEYLEEKARGYDHTEDLASPGTWRFDLSAHQAVLMFGAEGHDALTLDGGAAPLERYDGLRRLEEKRRKKFASRLERSADAFISVRGDGKTIVAGYPWFTDWGRDTFIAMRGLCLSTGRLDDAEGILLKWSAQVSEGMLPNRFTEEKDAPEFNAVDASLWFIVAVADFLKAVGAAGRSVTKETKADLDRAVCAILEGFARGTRHGIRMDDDGLLTAGEQGVQLTWMDAKVGSWVVTPRIGKPVEVEALWINALRIGSAIDKKFGPMADVAQAAFDKRFWNDDKKCLFDVVDNMKKRNENDDAMRPNQILAVGGLPHAVISGEHARAVVDAVEKELLTPIGLRSLSPKHPSYAPRYEGGTVARDGAYHQGTVWVWLMGPFIEAWVRVRGGTNAAKKEAREKFLDPMLARLDDCGLGHLAEIADGDAPHDLRGAPFQAWSLGEALRVDRVVLAPHAEPAEKKPTKSPAKPAPKSAAPETVKPAQKAASSKPKPKKK